MGTINTHSGMTNDISINQSMSTNNDNTVAIDIRGTFVGTLQFEATVDSLTWFSLPTYAVGSTTAVTSATAPGAFLSNVAGFRTVRLRPSAWTSGTALITIRGETAILTSVASGGTSTSDATAANQTSQLTEAQTTNTRLGILTETAPATDTASAGVNGRLQRIAQRITSLIAQLPATLGIKTSALSLSITPASDASFVVPLPVLTATTDRSGTATTTSGGLSVAANAARKGLVGQNISGVSIGFNEQGGVAAIGTAGTYTVAAGGAFSISTNKLVNFIAAGGTAAVTLTEL